MPQTLIAGDPAGNWVRIYDAPCPVAGGWLAMRRAEMHYEGTDYGACWLQADDRIVVFDSAGDISPLPISAFRKDEPI